MPRVVFDVAALQELASSPSGPVAFELARLGAEIEGEVKDNLSGRVLSNGTTVNVDSGLLRGSARWRFIERGGNLGISIGVSPFYGAYLAGGTVHIERRPFLEDAVESVLGIPVPPI